VVVDLVDGVLEDLPCPLRVLGVELHALLERLDLEVALPRWAAATHRRRRVGFRGASGVGRRGRTWWWTHRDGCGGDEQSRWGKLDGLVFLCCWGKFLITLKKKLEFFISPSKFQKFVSALNLIFLSFSIHFDLI
jgi:hypothetical protein